MKRILYSLAVLVFITVFLASTRAAQADVLFENVFREEQNGVVYERIRQMTTYGMLDVHVLVVPLDDPNIYIAPVVSQRAHGRKDTATNLLSDVDAVAGINADFFGLAGQYSVHFGPMAMDGQLLGLNPNTNANRNDFATFFLDSAGNPFFDYMRSEVRFYNNGVENVQVASLNIIGLELHSPVIIDRRLMNNTLPLFDRFDELIKFVVQGERVTRVARGPVDVPANGYVLVMPQHMYDSHRHLINAGDSARLYVGNSLGIDFSRIQTAIGGGGMILSGGETVYGRGVSPNARHPRSAIGVTRDGNSMILMVADGRSHSIGATHNEMADLLRRFGAWDAMHFDGGGSSTMVRRDATGSYTVENTPSDGAQRRIINALGVFDRRQFVPQDITIPPLAELRGHPSAITLFEDGQHINLRLSGVGVDGNYVTNIPFSTVADYAVVPSWLGYIQDGVFTATSSGSGYLVMTVQGINTYVPIAIGGTPRALNTRASMPSFVGYPAAYISGDVGRMSNTLWLEYSFIAASITQAAHMALYPTVALPENAVAVNMLVEGNGSGHWLRGRVRDGAGRLHNIDFVREMDFYDWTLVTAVLPTGAVSPFVLDRIYMVTTGSDEAATFRIQFGGLEAFVAPELPVDVPVGPVFRDTLRAERGFAGFSGTNFSFSMPDNEYELEYDTTNEGPFSVTTMTLYGGRLGTEQWAAFMHDIRSINPSYVVILMDDNPRTAFRHDMEFELLHLALTELQTQERRVFVVSATGQQTSVHVRDDIRYINLNYAYEYIHFRVNGNQIRWSD
ncbi:MAG: phosphodiester glycosidase family protein [Defluviitaleaceae bacterium]|nr:phosphodiester glycosidase family protein [Defluviitaleaceae bacterium]